MNTRRFDRVPGLEGFCDGRYKGIKRELIMRFRREGGSLSGWIWNRSCTLCRIDCGTC